MGTNHNGERPKMTFLEFLDRNGEGLAWFVIALILCCGFVFKACGN
jgi:hypothetical protein